MSRLTKKDYKDWWHPAGTVINEQSSLYLNEVNHKLGKLEDLEDELSCPLDVVFKALKDKEIYITHNSEIILDDSPALCFSYEGWHLYTCSGFIEYLSDYKKTWFLKEDLSE